jgi:hypothetical protein
MAELRVKPTEWLVARQKQIQAEIDRRHPKISLMEVELMRFNTPSPATGLVYRMNPDVMKAIQDFSKRPIFCEYGLPVVSRDRTADDRERIAMVDEQRVCGSLSGVRINPETFVLYADFTTMGPFGEVATQALNEGTARMTCRAFSDTDHANGTRDIKQLITFDVVPNNTCLEYELPNWKETL